VVCGVRRGMAVAPTGNQTKVADYQMMFVTTAQLLMLMCYSSPAWEQFWARHHASRVLSTSWATDKIHKIHKMPQIYLPVVS